MKKRADVVKNYKIFNSYLFYNLEVLKFEAEYDFNKFFNIG